ncbi:MAG TPA: AAA family ATPase [Candidatus Omnitrophota bacterium]|nr:AAA family ATPase [Candidatus Omnitrophota bacterium]HPD85170.1 AAA family ATPase [Candidatus Omnitrophota bacterium]HRZ04329.1 AAA family ATPase [Candidatus Omnitrophota bacterium]
MYCKHYGFSESPFTITPNSRFFFASSRHTEALNTMIYAIEQRKGFVVITGEIGSGKTTVCRTLLNRLDQKTHTALITNTNINNKDLLLMIMDELGINYTMTTKAKLLNQLNEYLIEQLRHDCNVVLIIDEAQNLKPSVLEEVRLLSNLETETEKLIQIILLGQPELKKKLGLDRLEQFRQRIAVYYHLDALNPRETNEYVTHRLRMASNSDRKYFTDGALELVYKFSQGIPRLVNQICDSALLTGYTQDVGVIDDKILYEVISESPMLQLAPNFQSKNKSAESKAENTSNANESLDSGAQAQASNEILNNL